MPCDDGSRERALPECYARLDRVTRLLCEACRRFEHSDPQHLTGELGAWWQEHQEIDRQREQREQEANEYQMHQKRRQFEQLKKDLGYA